jgi:hypothetical protein
MALCRSASSQFRKAVMAPASMWSRVSVWSGTDLTSAKKMISSLKASR